MPIPFNHPEQKERALKILSEVKLNYFSAEPMSGGPFHNYTLRWSVEKPSGVWLTLNGTRMEATGQTEKQLWATTTFRLVAHVSIYARVLGTVTVNVNLASCMLASSGDSIEAFLSTLIKAYMQDSDDFAGYYFPDGWKPEIKISDNDCYFNIRFRKTTSIFPDPDVTLAAHFSIGVNRVRDQVMFDRFTTKAVATVKSIHSNVTVPYWVWFIPGAVPALSIILGRARGDAKVKSREMCQDITDALITLIELFNEGNIPPGNKLHDIRLYESAGGSGMADARYCPVPVIPVDE